MTTSPIVGADQPDWLTKTNPRTVAPASSARSTHHDHRAPRRVATDVVPAGCIDLEIGARIGDRQPGAGEDGHRDEDREGGRHRAGRADSAEDRQQRDPDRERQPRPGGALGEQVVGGTDGEDHDPQHEQRRTRQGR